jgi:PPM family protein phosphatase
MEINVGNAQNIGARQQQEDSFAFSDPTDRHAVEHGGFLGIVADGMGGLSNGKQASSAAVQVFLAAYQAKPPEEPIADALQRALLDANQAVGKLTTSDPSQEAGTTLVAAVVAQKSLYWVSAGDSRIYWLHDNELTRLTADHVHATRLHREVATGKLSREAAEGDPQRAALTSYLGQPELALIDRNVKPLELHSNECVILCSDGFYHAVTEAEIISHFQGDPQTACDRLVELALAKARRQQDNLTVIAFRARAGETGKGHPSPFAKVSLLLVSCIAIVLAAAAAGYRFRGLLFHSSGNRPVVGAAPATKPDAPPVAAAPVTVSNPKPKTGGANSPVQPTLPATGNAPPNPAPAQNGRSGNKKNVAKDGPRGEAGEHLKSSAASTQPQPSPHTAGSPQPPTQQSQPGQQPGAASSGQPKSGQQTPATPPAPPAAPAGATPATTAPPADKTDKPQPGDKQHPGNTPPTPDKPQTSDQPDGAAKPASPAPPTPDPQSRLSAGSKTVMVAAASGTEGYGHAICY